MSANTANVLWSSWSPSGVLNFGAHGYLVASTISYLHRTTVIIDRSSDVIICNKLFLNSQFIGPNSLDSRPNLIIDLKISSVPTNECINNVMLSSLIRSTLQIEGA